MIYLDWAASSPPEPDALETLREISSRHFGNPSSPHGAGRASHDLLEEARGRLSSLLGGGEVVFTSGATESNAAFLLTLLGRQRKADVRGKAVTLVISAIEHASVYEQARQLEELGISCVYVSPDRSGVTDPGRIAESLDAETAMVSIMTVNNETGAIQRIREICRVVRDFSSRSGRKILLHTDAAQAFGKIPFNPGDLGVDAASLSGHKIGGPRGVGALWLRSGVNPDFLAAGGGQESGRRPGTENLPGICALLTAAEKRTSRLSEDLAAARQKADRLLQSIREIPGARIFPESRSEAQGAGGSEAPGYSPYILSFGFPPLPGEVVVRLADSKGIQIGMGSACSSRKKARTRILEKMGVRPEIALSAVRVSFGPSTPFEDLDTLADLLKEEVPPLLAFTRGKGS